MKLLIENWRKKMEEDFKMKGADYEPMVSQAEPEASREKTTMELLDQLDELVEKIKDSVGGGSEEPAAPTATKWSKAGANIGDDEDVPFEE